MIFGMPPFTLFHVVLSLVGIVAGLVVVIGLLGSGRLAGWTAIFLASTVATSVTGFGFPFQDLLASHILGILSLAVLAAAIAARYGFHLAGAWRWIYAVTATIALYFNVFVLIVQLYLKVPALHALAPTQSEPPFAITQAAALILFVALGALAAIRFRPAAAATA